MKYLPIILAAFIFSSSSFSQTKDKKKGWDVSTPESA
jgi:hypothetical protein